MKICSVCQASYSDELQFCLQDGSALVAATGDKTLSWSNSAEGESPTVVRGDGGRQIRFDLPRQQEIRQVEPLQPPPPSRQDWTAPATAPQYEEPKKSKLPLVLGGVLGALALLGVGALAMWFLTSRNPTVVANVNAQRNSTPAPNNANSNGGATNSNENVNANANANANSTPTPTPKPTLKPAEIETAKKEAAAVLRGWKNSAENINLDENMSYYADAVDYYKGGKVGKGKVKANKESAYKKFDSIEINISNEKIVPSPTGDKVTVTFDKEWNFAGVDENGGEISNSGKVQQQIILTKSDGKWKITGEKDAKIYYVNKSKPNVPDLPQY